MAKPKVLFFDIETSNLNANYGFMLAAAWKWKGNKKVQYASITQSPTFKKEPTNDKYVAVKIAEAISEADIIVGHYSVRFDFPYINARLLYHGLQPMPPVPHVDTWRISKYKLKLNSNRLATIAEFFDLEQKTPLNGPIWIKAMAGDPKAIKYVVDHNVQDVIVLEQVYDKIKNLSTTHPNIALIEGHRRMETCPICGVEGKMHKRGTTIAHTSKKQRWQCQDCGGWSHSNLEKDKSNIIR